MSDQRLAAYAIEEMFKGRCFDICTVRECGKLMGVGVSGESKAYARLSVLHTKPWADIPQDIMEMIPVWINECLGGPRLSVMQIPALLEGNHELPPMEDSPGINARLGKPKT